MADLLDWEDSKIAMAKMKMANLIGFKRADVTIDDMRDKMSKITLEDVIRAANKVNIKKVFVLGGVENA